ncbi:MAG TPA: phosphoribosylglycinamide formyltransferase [Gemmatimonadaceae bacterium]
MKPRIAVLASGGGTNLQAILERLARNGEAEAEIAVVASNREGAGALDRARKHGVPVEVFDSSDDGTELLDLLQRHSVQLVALAGYLKRIPPLVTAHFRGRIINVHPGPLPEFGGEGMYGSRVHAAVLASGATATAVTVHFVDDEYDHGSVIAQWPVRVTAEDTVETLAERVLRAEHVVYPRVVEMIAALNAAGLPGDL